MRKVLFTLVLALLCMGTPVSRGTLFAQEKASQTDRAPRNAVSGGFYAGLVVFIPDYGINLEYERMLLGKVLGAAAEASAGAFIWMPFPTFQLNAKLRVYPFARRFFIDAGIAYKNIQFTRDDVSAQAFSIPLGVGWKIDFGEPGGFILVPSLGFDALFIAKINSKASGWGTDLLKDAEGVLPFFKAGLRFGYSF